MNTIYAPFTPEQVENLDAYQKAGQFHPFTCPGDKMKKGGCEIRELLATPDGWICPCGEYIQSWCHDWMANAPSESPIVLLLRQKKEHEKARRSLSAECLVAARLRLLDLGNPNREDEAWEFSDMALELLGTGRTGLSLRDELDRIELLISTQEKEA